ncbi:MAG: hypothetical protein ACTS4T_01170 [Candidatus Hodgkinia cicadicola]
MECVWIPKARSIRRLGASRLRNGPSEVNLPTKMLEDRRRWGNINERLMKINVREELKCGRCIGLNLAEDLPQRYAALHHLNNFNQSAAGVKAAEGVR